MRTGPAACAGYVTPVGNTHHNTVQPLERNEVVRVTRRRGVGRHSAGARAAAHLRGGVRHRQYGCTAACQYLTQAAHQPVRVAVGVRLASERAACFRGPSSCCCYTVKRKESGHADLCSLAPHQRECPALARGKAPPQRLSLSCALCLIAARAGVGELTCTSSTLNPAARPP